MSAASHGDGRRMTLIEAINRRRFRIGFYGSIEGASYAIPTHLGEDEIGTPHQHDRRWAQPECTVCEGEPTESPDDVELLDGVPVAMCRSCREAQR